MKNMLLLIVLFLSINLFSQRVNEHISINIKKNEISEVQIFNVGTSKKYLFKHIYYDNFGNILKEMVYNKNGTLWIKTSYQYDDKQQYISSLNETYEYDKSENRINSKIVKTDSLVFYSKKKVDIEIKGNTRNYYNKKGELTKSKNSRGVLIKYKYDKYGNLIEEKTVDNKGIIIYHRIYKYKIFKSPN